MSESMVSTNPILVSAAANLMLAATECVGFEQNSRGFKIIGFDQKVLVESSDLMVGLMWLWEQGETITLKLCGSYFLKVTPKYNMNNRPCFTAIVVKNKVKGNQNVQVETYNFLEGYWYTPDFLASEQVKRLITSYSLQRIRTVLNVFNDRD